MVVVGMRVDGGTVMTTQQPSGTGRRWVTRPGAVVVSLLCAGTALALSWPHAVTLAKGATRPDDIYLTWPLLTMYGPGIEHVYLGLAVIAMFLAVPSLRSGSQASNRHRAAIVSCCVALVPLVVAFARLLISIYWFMQLTPP